MQKKMTVVGLKGILKNKSSISTTMENKSSLFLEGYNKYSNERDFDSKDLN